MNVGLRALLAEVPTAWSFLVSDFGFQPAEQIADGLRYERPGLAIEVTVWSWNHETGFSTRLRATRADDDDGERAESLDDICVRLGFGPAQDVGSNAASGHTVRKQVHEHARALVKVLAIDDLARTIGAGHERN